MITLAKDAQEFARSLAREDCTQFIIALENARARTRVFSRSECAEMFYFYVAECLVFGLNSASRSGNPMSYCAYLLEAMAKIAEEGK